MLETAIKIILKHAKLNEEQSIINKAHFKICANRLSIEFDITAPFYTLLAACVI